MIFLQVKKLKRSYKIILFSYIGMLLLLQPGTIITYQVLQWFGLKETHSLQIAALSIWYSLCFFGTLFISLYYLKDELRQSSRQNYSWIKIILWSIAGVFLALIAQTIAIEIELFFGSEVGSENTETILALIKQAPVFFFVTAIIGPILEETVFRKIIFGTLNQKYNFHIAAVISSLVFSLAHFEFEHIILYFAVGFVFAYLYNKTKRILVPILSHILMNTSVIIFVL